MSYTVVIDERERDRRFENRLNAVVRHCRIGKVTKKQSPLAPLLSPPSEEFYEALRQPVSAHDFQRRFLVGSQV